MSDTNNEPVKAAEVFTVTAVAGHQPAACHFFAESTRSV